MGLVLLVARLGWRDLRRRILGRREAGKIRVRINLAAAAAVLLMIMIVACGTDHSMAGQSSAVQALAANDARDSLATCYSRPRSGWPTVSSR